MSNLLPPQAQKRMRAQFRARFLLVFSLVLLISAILFALALLPAEASLLSFASPDVQQNAQNNTTLAADSAALVHTKALLAQLAPMNATSSLDALAAALSQTGPGITIDDIEYSVSGQTISLAGHAQTPDEVNTFNEALQSDLRFGNVSVPVSALLGSQDGSFTITMKVLQ
jgi:Tfp pilus assembly protein PilN